MQNCSVPFYRKMKKTVLIILALLALVGCYDGSYRVQTDWYKWRQEVIENPDVFTDPGEREAFLRGRWLTGMSIEEVDLVLQPIGGPLGYAGTFWRVYASSGGWEQYEWDDGGTKYTFWFKYGILDRWSLYDYWKIFAY